LLIVRESASGGTLAAAYPATPTSTPSDGTFCPDAPIQFDLTTPGGSSSLKEGPPKYVVSNDSSLIWCFNIWNSAAESIVLIYYCLDLPWLGTSKWKPLFAYICTFNHPSALWWCRCLQQQSVHPFCKESWLWLWFIPHPYEHIDVIHVCQELPPLLFAPIVFSSWFLGPHVTWRELLSKLLVK